MSEQLLVEVPGATELIELATQGPPGIQGPPGPSAGAGAEYTAAQALGGHRAIALTLAGQAVYASALQAGDRLRVAGITLGAAGAGDLVTVQSAGLIVHAGWSFTPDQPVYLGEDGLLVQALPPGAVFSQVVGLALAATRLLVTLQPPIDIAA